MSVDFRIKIAFSFLLIIIQASGQERIDQNQGILYAWGDHQTGRYVRIYKDRYAVTDLETLITSERYLGQFPTMPGKNRLHIVMGDLLMTEDESRTVFNVGLDSVFSIHRDRRTKSEICHTEFVFQDTLYHFGGYGFWSAQSKLTLFDRKTSEWKPVAPLVPGPEPTGMFNQFQVIGMEKWYFFGGRTVDKADPMDQPLNVEAWIFDRKKKSWKSAGKINQKLVQTREKEIFSFQKEETIYLFPVNGTILEADFKSEKLRIHRMTPLAMSASTEHRIYQQPVLYDGKVYFIRSVKKVESEQSEGIEGELISVPFERFIGPLIGEESLYNGGSSLTWWWLMLPVAAVGLVLPFRKKLRRSTGVIFLQSDAMICDGISHPLDEKSVALLKLLLSSPEGVGSATILELIQNPALDISQNTRTKIRMVETLNIQLRNILDTREDVIRVEKSDIDRRIKVYRIDRDKFRLS